MGRRTAAEWGRILRTVATNLTSSVREIFGSTEAVIYKPSDPKPHREGDPSADHSHTTAHPSGKADGLPPRERRGRD